MRVLARNKTHLEIYQISGKDHTQDILYFLNNMFSNKGLQFDRVIITCVRLPNDIAGPLDQKAQFGSMNEYEKTKHEFDLRIINDDEELELLKQRKQEERDEITETFQKELALVEREDKIINAELEKSVAEIDARKTAETKRLTAESELKGQEINAETKIIQNKLLAEGKAEALKIKVDAQAKCQMMMANKMSEVADKNSEAIRIQGTTEGELAKVLASRRQYEFLNKKLDVVKAIGQNPNIKIFGNQSDNVVSQMAAYRLLHPNDNRM